MIGFWAYGLFDLDEGIYAASLKEMMQRGDPFVITFGGVPFLEKPILIYWVAWGFNLVGIGGELGLRLGSVLSSIGTMWISSWFARRHFGDSVGLWTLLILGCSTLFMGVARMFMPDALMVFFLTCSLLLLWESLENPRLRWVSAGAAGLAALAKGPVAPLFYVVIVVYIGWRLPEVRKRLRGRWLASLGIFAAIIGIWYVPIAVLQGREFFQEFIIYQNIARLMGADVYHRADFYMYIPVLIISLAPFIFAAVGAFKRKRATPVEAFLWAWVIIVFVIFSAAWTKLPHYILPSIPPLAMLLSSELCERRPSAWIPVAWALFACALAWVGWAIWQPYRDGLLIVAFGATIGVMLSLRAISRGGGFGPASLATAWPLTVAACVFGIPVYWKIMQRDAFEAAKVAYEHGSQSVVEFRMEALGAHAATSHPSTHYYFGRPAKLVFWFDDLLVGSADGFRLITRRGRLTQAHVEELSRFGADARLTGRWGEYEVYQLSERAKDQ